MVLRDGRSKNNRLRDGSASVAIYTVSYLFLIRQLCACSSGGDMDMLMSTADRLKVYNSVKEMLCYVCDFAHDRCVKLMLARGKVGHHKVATISLLKSSQGHN